ncbi:MAG TPA: helix-turn-helix domain-containing protein [Gemmataceae bacterium]|nr:helix-turn-helix domain-containing protein [Gemmataceae bacterium]
MAVAESPPSSKPRLEKILTLAEAAAYLRVPEDALLKLADEGAVPARRIGGEWRFLRKALDDWLRYSGRPVRDVWPASAHWMQLSFAEQVLFLIENRILHKPEAASPKAGSKEAVLKHFGVFRDDKDMEEQLANLRVQREAT